MTCLGNFHAVGAEVVLGGVGQWMVSEGTQTGEDGGLVQINVPLQQVCSFRHVLNPFHLHRSNTVDAED